MEQFKLQPIDFLVNINDRNDPYSIVKRWAVGPYDHVFMYMGEMELLIDNTILRHPMLFESNGRGVVIQSLTNRYNQKVVVMRFKSEYYRGNISNILSEAILLASDIKSYYDYYAIITAVFPRILREKLYLPVPISWHRDARQVCSEAINEVCLRSNITLFPFWDVPLPGDYVTGTLLLEEVGRVILSDAVV